MTAPTTALPRWAHAGLLVISIGLMLLGTLSAHTSAAWVGMAFGLLTRLDAVFVPMIVPLVEKLTGEAPPPPSEAETPPPVTVDPSKSR